MENKNRFVQMAVVVFAGFLVAGTLAANLSGKYGQDGWRRFFTEMGDAV